MGFTAKSFRKKDRVAASAWKATQERESFYPENHEVKDMEKVVQKYLKNRTSIFNITKDHPIEVDFKDTIGNLSSMIPETLNNRLDELSDGEEAENELDVQRIQELEFLMNSVKKRIENNEETVIETLGNEKLMEEIEKAVDVITKRKNTNENIRIEKSSRNRGIVTGRKNVTIRRKRYEGMNHYTESNYNGVVELTSRYKKLLLN